MKKAWTQWEVVQKGWFHVLNIRRDGRVYTHNNLQAWSGAKEELWAREAVGHMESLGGGPGLWWAGKRIGALLEEQVQGGQSRAAMTLWQHCQWRRPDSSGTVHPLLRALQAYDSTKEFHGFWWVTTRFNACCLLTVPGQLCTLWIPTSDLAQNQ